MTEKTKTTKPAPPPPTADLLHVAAIIASGITRDHALDPAGLASRSLDIAMELYTQTHARLDALEHPDLETGAL